jgi:hypothetical protein
MLTPFLAQIRFFCIELQETGHPTQIQQYVRYQLIGRGLLEQVGT